MKKKILTISLFIATIVSSYYLGSKTEPDVCNYIKCDSFENFEVYENELHIITNDGNEYVFYK